MKLELPEYFKNSYFDLAQEIRDKMSRIPTFSNPMSELVRNQMNALQSSFDITEHLNWVNDVLQFQDINDRALKLSMQSEIFENLKRQQESVLFKTFNEFNYLNKMLYNNLNLNIHKSLFYTKFEVPVYVLNALNRINTQQERFDMLLSHTNSQFSIVNNHITNWNRVIKAYKKSLSRQLDDSINKGKWEDVIMIQEFDEIISDFPIETNTLPELYAKLNSWAKDISNKFQEIKIKNLFVNYTISIAWHIFCAYMAIYGFKKDSQPEEQPISNYATKEDISSVKELVENLRTDIQQKSVGIAQSCKIYSKPNNNSMVVDSLLQDDEVLILQMNRKWALISQTKSGNNIIAGWISKDCLKVH